MLQVLVLASTPLCKKGTMRRLACYRYYDRHMLHTAPYCTVPKVFTITIVCSIATVQRSLVSFPWSPESGQRHNWPKESSVHERSSGGEVASCLDRRRVSVHFHATSPMPIDATATRRPMRHEFARCILVQANHITKR